MSNNYDEYEYNDNDSNGSDGSVSNFLKKVGIALLIIIAIIIILFLIKGCTARKGGNEKEPVFKYEDALLDAGKKYFELNIDEYPKAIGECATVSLQDLMSNNLVDSEKFSECNSVNTLVRVCMLENGSYQYTPWFACNDKLSSDEYGATKEGTLNDIIADETYVEFLFLPQVLQYSEELGKVEEMWKSDIKYPSYKTLGTTTYYKYRDHLYKWNVTKKLYYTSKGEKTDASNVDEYYTSAPSSKYNNSDSKTTEAYKWYTTTSKKEYALSKNGEKAFSSKPIGDYNMNEGGIIMTAYQTRTVTGTYDPTMYYMCSTSTTSSYVVFQTEPCGSSHNPSYKVLRDTIYSCADPNSNKDSVIAGKVAKGSKCTKYSAWGNTSFNKCDTTKPEICRSASVTFYNWYKLVDSGDRTYYPSKASSASGEKVYYTKAPVAGAIKDTATKTTAYKWYSLSSITTSDYTAVAPSGYATASKTKDSKWTEWSNWSKSNPKIKDGRERQIESRVKVKLQEIKQVSSTDWNNLSEDYVSQEQLIKIFANKGYDVATLEDINNNGEIKYQVKMYVRNKEAK